MRRLLIATGAAALLTIALVATVAAAARRRGTVRCAAARAPCARAGVAQLAERQPSKLHVAGSIPVSRSTSLVRARDDTQPALAGLLGDQSKMPNRVLKRSATRLPA